MINNQIVPVQIGKWTILQKIGEGSFGAIYSAKLTKPQQNSPLQQNQQIAIKTQLINNIKQMVLLQYKIYKQLEGIRGFPKVYEHVEEERYSYLAMEKLQLTLDRFAANKYPNHFIPTSTLLEIMYQIQLLLKNLHKKNYLYRDIKPTNLMLKNPYQQIYLIDLGLCKKYIINNRHINQKKNKKIIGTPIFCSINTHSEQSRRDDMESWIYLTLYFALELPWQSIITKKDLNKQLQNQQMYSIKKIVKWDQYIKQINQNRNNHMRVPISIIKIIEDIQQLSFQEEPHYQYYQKMIKNEYNSLVGKAMEDNTITWQLNNNNIIKQLQPISQDLKKPIGQAKKVSKINFKAPLKQKQNNNAIGIESNIQKQPTQQLEKT